MKISGLYAVNFRNYTQCQLKLASMINVFYGKNAQGKTNFLWRIWAFASHLDRRGFIKAGDGRDGCGH